MEEKENDPNFSFDSQKPYYDSYTNELYYRGRGRGSRGRGGHTNYTFPPPSPPRMHSRYYTPYRFSTEQYYRSRGDGPPFSSSLFNDERKEVKNKEIRGVEEERDRHRFELGKKEVHERVKESLSNGLSSSSSSSLQHENDPYPYYSTSRFPPFQRGRNPYRFFRIKPLNYRPYHSNRPNPLNPSLPSSTLEYDKPRTSSSCSPSLISFTSSWTNLKHSQSEHHASSPSFSFKDKQDLQSVKEKWGECAVYRIGATVYIHQKPGVYSQIVPKSPSSPLLKNFQSARALTKKILAEESIHLQDHATEEVDALDLLDAYNSPELTKSTKVNPTHAKFVKSRTAISYASTQKNTLQDTLNTHQPLGNIRKRDFVNGEFNSKNMNVDLASSIDDLFNSIQDLFPKPTSLPPELPTQQNIVATSAFDTLQKSQEPTESDDIIDFYDSLHDSPVIPQEIQASSDQLFSFPDVLKEIDSMDKTCFQTNTSVPSNLPSISSVLDQVDNLTLTQDKANLPPTLLSINQSEGPMTIPLHLASPHTSLNESHQLTSSNKVNDREIVFLDDDIDLDSDKPPSSCSKDVVPSLLPTSTTSRTSFSNNSTSFIHSKTSLNTSKTHSPQKTVSEPLMALDDKLSSSIQSVQGTKLQFSPEEFHFISNLGKTSNPKLFSLDLLSLSKLEVNCLDQLFDLPSSTAPIHELATDLEAILNEPMVNDIDHNSVSLLHLSEPSTSFPSSPLPFSSNPTTITSNSCSLTHPVSSLEVSPNLDTDLSLIQLFDDTSHSYTPSHCSSKEVRSEIEIEKEKEIIIQLKKKEEKEKQDESIELNEIAMDATVNSSTSTTVPTPIPFSRSLKVGSSSCIESSSDVYEKVKGESSTSSLFSPSPFITTTSLKTTSHMQNLQYDLESFLKSTQPLPLKKTIDGDFNSLIHESTDDGSPALMREADLLPRELNSILLNPFASLSYASPSNASGGSIESKSNPNHPFPTNPFSNF